MIFSKIKDGCSVGFFGLGRSNISLLSSLPLEKCRVTLRSDETIDRSTLPRLARIDRILERDNAARDITEDVIFFSPSVRRERPELTRARDKGVIFCSDAELFFSENRRPVFAVTGSDGKSTTATLIHLLLQAGGTDSRLIGNIGEPMWPALQSDADCFVAELSSFMLRYAKARAERGCITNITPNHLDWHSDFNEYKETKLSLADNTKELVISDENTNFDYTYGIISDKTAFYRLKRQRRAEVYITLEDGYICKNGKKLIAVCDIPKKEKHNIKNLMMAIAMTDGYATDEAIRMVATSFRGLAHRCECFLERGGVKYIDSSIDSTPDRTAQTLASLSKEVIIILGGRGKRLDYSPLREPLKKYAKGIIICGENADEIYDGIGSMPSAWIIDDFDRAVRRGIELSENVGTLLLSPASTSFDKFRNYAERGDRFKEIILKNTLF